MKGKLRLAMVTWEDCEHMEGWHTQIELEDYVQQPLSVFKSLGWLVHNGEDTVVLAQTIGEHSSGEILKIPRVMVKDVHLLSEDRNGS